MSQRVGDRCCLASPLCNIVGPSLGFPLGNDAAPMMLTVRRDPTGLTVRRDPTGLTVLTSRQPQEACLSYGLAMGLIFGLSFCPRSEGAFFRRALRVFPFGGSSWGGREDLVGEGC